MIKVITKNEIDGSLKGVTRQYLAGTLSRPQKLEYVPDADIEIGITSYDSFAHEEPHVHPVAREYQYVISGETKYIDLSESREHLFKEGDFFMIYPDTPYAQKSQPGTAILFIKTPAGNDKTAVEKTDAVEKWEKDWEAGYDSADL